MNRDCECQHHARNILVDPIENFAFNDREQNVQNALELLAGGEDIRRFSNMIKSLETELTSLINLKNQVKVLEDKIGNVVSKYNLYGVVNTDGIYLNPYYSQSNEEPYYYRTIFWNGEGLIFPDTNGTGNVNYDDYNCLFHLRFAIDEAYKENEVELLKAYLSQTVAERDLNNAKYKDFYLLSPQFSQIAIDLLDNERNITDYDLQLLSDYIKDKTVGKLIYIDDENEPSAIEESEEGFNNYVSFKNPLLKAQWPDLNDDGILNSKDASQALIISANIGAGNLEAIEPKYKKWIKDYMNSTFASHIYRFSAEVGAGNFENSPDGWAQYMLIQEGK